MVKVRGALSRDGTHHLLVAADPYVAQDCARLQERNEKHMFDTCEIIAGNSGDGKSTFAITTLAPLLARDVKDIYVCWSTDEGIKIGRDLNTKELSVIVIDESESDLASGQHQAQSFKRFRNFLSECRMKRYYILLILPTFFSLSSNFALFRSNVLYQIESQNNRRGYLKAFGRDSKLLLFIKGKRYFDINAHPPDYSGGFAYNKSLLDEICPDYTERKLQHFRDNDSTETSGAREEYLNNILDNVVLHLKIMSKKEFTHPKIAEFCGVSENSVKASFKRLKDAGVVPEGVVDYSNWYNKFKQTSQNVSKNTLQVTKS